VLFFMTLPTVEPDERRGGPFVRIG
jgi:hypothetical protein